jgi:hypothetical protein
MPRIVTAVHDPTTLAATCRELGLPPPRAGGARLYDEQVSGRVVRLPGLHGPLVFDTLTGLVAYHPADNAHDRYARILGLVYRCYAVRARPRGAGGRPAARRVAGVEGRAGRRGSA